MLGNVWEWVSGPARGDGRRPGKSKLSAKEREDLAKQRVLRGGSFVDTSDGSHNHMISVWIMNPGTNSRFYLRFLPLLIISCSMLFLRSSLFYLRSVPDKKIPRTVELITLVRTE